VLLVPRRAHRRDLRTCSSTAGCGRAWAAPDSLGMRWRRTILRYPERGECCLPSRRANRP